MTEQNRTEQNRTEQNRTEQNRTEQNRTVNKLSWEATLFLIFLLVWSSVTYIPRCEICSIFGLPDISKVSDLSKYELIEVFGLIQKLMGRNYIPDANPTNDVYRMKNGQLTFVDRQVIDTVPIVEKFDHLKALLDHKSTNLLYIQLPNKICQSLLPPTITDYADETADNLLKGLAGVGIDTLDLRTELRHQNKDLSSMFLATDHHWRPESGLWAARTIAQVLNDKYGLSYDTNLLDDNSFNTHMYRNSLLVHMVSVPVLFIQEEMIFV